MRLFAFDLALALGWPDPDAMLAYIPLATFHEWMEYATRKPFGEERADLRMGILASALINIQLAKGERRTRPIDFMPKFAHDRTERKRQTPQEVRTLIECMMATQQKQMANANRS